MPKKGRLKAAKVTVFASLVFDVKKRWEEIATANSKKTLPNKMGVLLRTLSWQRAFIEANASRLTTPSSATAEHGAVAANVVAHG